MPDIRNLLIPDLANNFQHSIEQLINFIHSQRAHTVEIYRQAEELLLSELGLRDWQPKHQLCYVKQFLDTETASRIDAEYFQPMYDEIMAALIRHGYAQRLGDLVEIKKCMEPGSEAYQEEGVPFIRVSNLSKFGISDNNQQYLSRELYSELKKHQPEKGEILLSKDATPGIAYHLADAPEPMIPSGGILRLKIEDESRILPEYLTLVLNAVTTQKQVERDVGGSIIVHWLTDQVKDTLIPVLDMPKQQTISAKAKESFALRQKSKALLDIAKRGVEMAIEQDEKTAEHRINKELVKLNIPLESLCN